MHKKKQSKHIRVEGSQCHSSRTDKKLSSLQRERLLQVGRSWAGKDLLERKSPVGEHRGCGLQRTCRWRGRWKWNLGKQTREQVKTNPKSETV